MLKYLITSFFIMLHFLLQVCYNFFYSFVTLKTLDITSFRAFLYSCYNFVNTYVRIFLFIYVFIFPHTYIYIYNYVTFYNILYINGLTMRFWACYNFVTPKFIQLWNTLILLACERYRNVTTFLNYVTSRKVKLQQLYKGKMKKD